MLKETIRIGIIEDNEKLRSNYTDFFSLFSNYILCFAFGSLNEFKKTINTQNILVPDIILLDINLPGISGIEGIAILKSCYPKTIIIMLTAYPDSDYIINAIEKGAVGYLIKGISLHEIKSYIDNFKTGGSAITPNVATKLLQHIHVNHKKQSLILYSLTSREKEIAKCITDGLTYKETGIKLGIKSSTVNQHLKSIYIKLDVNSQSELTSKVLKN